MKKAVNTEEKLQTTNKLLFQKDADIKEEWQKAAVVATEKAELKKRLQAEIESVEDATYAM